MATTESIAPRRWGAHPFDDARWSFAIWAPSAQVAEVELEGVRHPLISTSDGWRAGAFPASEGNRYRFVLDDQPLPDPAARAQAEDVHGPSVLVAPPVPTESPWRGRPWRDAVIMEVHVGTFTEAGTFAAATERLAELAELGINTLSLMPIAHAPGQRGWGYDGVLPGAPHPAYGTPEDFRAFVEAAHAQGFSVLLDVVFNHLGPDGAYILGACPEMTSETPTPWGKAFDFSQPAVRAFFVEFALRWLEEYALDGFRFDAVHQMHDSSEEHILAEIGRHVREREWMRPIHLVTEDERNDASLKEAGLFDGQWNDDYHHAIHVLLTGESEGYYRAFAEDPLKDLETALTEGFVAQGQPRVGWPDAPGQPSAHLDPEFFVNSNQTHDQIGNRAFGDRLITLAPEPGVKAVHALLLTLPSTPMLFQGEERGETAPFQYFADHSGDLADAVREGRRAEMSAFAAFDAEDVPDPNAPETHQRSLLGWATDDRARAWLDLTRRALALRSSRLLSHFREGAIQAPQSRATGPKSLRVQWTYPQAEVEIRLALGARPSEPLPPLASPDLEVGDAEHDPYFFQLEIRSR